MTGVPRLQHLPVPAVSAGALAVAAPQASGGQRIKEVLPVTAAERRQAESGWNSTSMRGTGRDAVDGGDSERGAAAGQHDAEPATGRLVSFSRLASLPFMVQLLGQHSAAGRSQSALPQSVLSGHRDAALMGSESYRRSGAEPEILPDGATFVRLAI